MPPKAIKVKQFVFTLEWSIYADDALDGIDGVKEALTAQGACRVVDVRIEEVESRS